MGVSALNPDFGYFNSQVSDKDAFRHYLNVPAGEKTQAELQELSQNTAMPSHVESGGDILRTHSDTAPITVKIEKENYPLGDLIPPHLWKISDMQQHPLDCTPSPDHPRPNAHGWTKILLSKLKTAVSRVS
jgi:hypothetical protein